jgi:hypothetical protein
LPSKNGKRATVDKTVGNKIRSTVLKSAQFRLVVRKYLVEVIKWQDRDELQNLGPRERRDAFGGAIDEGLEEAARAYYLKNK